MKEEKFPKNGYLVFGIVGLFGAIIFLHLIGSLTVSDALNSMLVSALVVATVHYAVHNEKMAKQLKKQVELSFEPVLQIPRLELSDNHGEAKSNVSFNSIRDENREYLEKVKKTRGNISGNRFINLIIKNTSQTSAHNIEVTFHFNVFKHDSYPLERESCLSGFGKFGFEELKQGERKVVELFNCSEYPVVSIYSITVTGRNQRRKPVEDILSYAPDNSEFRNEDLIKHIE